MSCIYSFATSKRSNVSVLNSYYIRFLNSITNHVIFDERANTVKTSEKTFPVLWRTSSLSRRPSKPRGPKLLLLFVRVMRAIVENPITSTKAENCRLNKIATNLEISKRYVFDQSRFELSRIYI